MESRKPGLKFDFVPIRLDEPTDTRLRCHSLGETGVKEMEFDVSDDDPITATLTREEWEALLGRYEHGIHEYSCSKAEIEADTAFYRGIKSKLPPDLRGDS